MKYFFIFFILSTFHLHFSSSIVTRKGLPYLTRSFYTHKNATIGEKECFCMNNCSCCEFVNILDIHLKKNICINLSNEQNGLIANISLDSVILKSTAIKDNSNVKLCATVPEDVFSKTCIEIDNISFKPTFIKVCLKMNFLSRYNKLQTRFGCVNLTRISSPDTQNNVLDQIKQSTKQLLYNPYSHPATLKIKIIKYPKDTSQIDHTKPTEFSAAKPPMTQISIEISSINNSLATVTNEQNLPHQITSVQSPVTQVVPFRFPSYKNSTKPTDLIQTSKSPIINKPVTMKPLNTNLIDKMKNESLKSPHRIINRKNQTIYNYTINHVKYFGSSNLSNVKEIKRFSEVTMPSEMQNKNLTISNQGILNDNKDKFDKINKRKKIRFPDGSAIRRNIYKNMYKAIVNHEFSHKFNDESWSTTSISSSETSHNTEQSVIHKNPTFYPNINEVLSYNPDLPTQDAESITPGYIENYFPSRIPSVEKYLRDVEELETPSPQGTLPPYSRLITNI